MEPLPTPVPIAESRSRYALIIALIGLLISGILTAYLAHASTTVWTAAEITSLVGQFIGIVGTLVGAFLGVQAATAGQQQAQAQTEAATQRAAALKSRVDNMDALLTQAQRETLR
ncbi:hypothetical protein [Hymenobacter negativus]|uniref:Holin n=1 Tax=Hymenobacter negativus TaxID=2795026 RepID=A0ABS3QAQ4_9BACT|nr:hypothetical protein [Hymenobacter negativus]MBO2008344.1 hypothetical protein [Hymenobacter negativus]